MTGVTKGLERVTVGEKRLQGIQVVTWGYKGLQWVTKGCMD